MLWRTQLSRNLLNDMASLFWTPLNGTRDHELHAFEADITDDTEGLVPPQSRDRQSSPHSQDVSSFAASNHQPPRPPLGRPTTKKRFHIVHLSAAIISLLCLALAITAVASEDVSWHLGVNNRQLIVLGFLLSIMNMCFSSVTPTLFLHLEARFGPSTLQNYNGILVNQISSSKLSIVWRLILGIALALPLGLGVAYKTFTGGSSAMVVNVTATIGGTSSYGMFAPPGLQLIGEKTGVSVFSNATLPFAVAASPPQNNSEQPLPSFPQPYGFNILLLGRKSAAMLDIPQPSYVSAVQVLLVGGESWNITAPVFATVATFNHSKTTDEEGYKSFFEDMCEAAGESSGAYTHASMMNDWSVVLLNRPSPGNQSPQFIGLTRDSGIEHVPTCSQFYPFAKLFDTNRQYCRGTWSITRGGIQLVDGSCNGTILPSEKQQIITSNGLFLGVWYMNSLVEFIGPFANSRNGSEWTIPSMATALAAMVWSRISVLNSPISQNEIHYEAPKEWAALTAEEAGVMYPVHDTAKHIRPTLRKSGLLYLLLSVQPLLILCILGLTATVLYSIPLDRGFGLISILSGVDRDSLDILAGAALSGKLRKDVKLNMRSYHDGLKGAVEYQVKLPSPTERSMGNEKLASNIIYH
ncbi:MAG: hypothetical protein LQ338_002346 [Usnochroma carphineum]|nr:MAG: hypothetical protein LQ338_002346 [Usnochroma carphineum]